MKKNALLLMFCLSNLVFCNNMYAQTDSLNSTSKIYRQKPARDDLKKGNRTLALNGIVTAPRYKRVNNSNWFITPQAGYFIANRLVAGFQLSTSMYFGTPKSGVTKSDSVQSFRVYSLAPEIYARYYVFKSRFTPFVQLSSGYSFQWGKKNEATKFFDNPDSQDFVLSGAVGISMLAGKRVRIEGLYNHGLISGSQVKYPSNTQKLRIGVSAFIR